MDAQRRRGCAGADQHLGQPDGAARCLPRQRLQPQDGDGARASGRHRHCDRRLRPRFHGRSGGAGRGLRAAVLQRRVHGHSHHLDHGQFPRRRRACVARHHPDQHHDESRAAGLRDRVHGHPQARLPQPEPAVEPALPARGRQLARRLHDELGEVCSRDHCRGHGRHRHLRRGASAVHARCADAQRGADRHGHDDVLRLVQVVLRAPVLRRDIGRQRPLGPKLGADW